MSDGRTRSIWTSILLSTVAGGSLLAVILFFKRRRAEAARAVPPRVPEPPPVWSPPSPPAPSPPAPPPTPESPPTEVSDRGLRFVNGFEGFNARLYNDPAGHCTIGIGHLVHLNRCNGSEPAEFRRGITLERGLELLADEMQEAAADVIRLVRVPLNQQQFDALGSFVFNVGEGNFATSTLLRLLNQGDYASVPAQLNRFVYGGGKKLPGLVTRRQAEGRLFTTGDYGDLVA
jgi:GH24 family phage-related lysozyme (muramidase)